MVIVLSCEQLRLKPKRKVKRQRAEGVGVESGKIDRELAGAGKLVCQIRFEQAS